MRELTVAREAAEAGGEVLRRSFRRQIVVEHKQADQTYNLVSEVDRQAEQQVAEVLRRGFAQYSILGEESHHASTAAEHLWVVDPLDGTNNFVHGIPHFAVSIAYYRDGRAECGVVYNPLTEDWYVARRNGGATHNEQPVAVSGAERLDEVLVGVGFYYDRGAMMEATLAAIGDLFRRQIHGIRRFGTASLDLAHVGLGRFGGYFEYELSPWDFAAGRLFVEEAGGRVTTCGGEPLPLAPTGLLASNGKLHEALLSIVHAHQPAARRGAP